MSAHSTAQHSTAQHSTFLACAARCTTHNLQLLLAYALYCLPTIGGADLSISRQTVDTTNRPPLPLRTAAKGGKKGGAAAGSVAAAAAAGRESLGWTGARHYQALSFSFLLPLSTCLPARLPTYLPLSPLLSSPLGRPIGQHDRPPGTLSPTHWTMHCYHN